MCANFYFFSIICVVFTFLGCTSSQLANTISYSLNLLFIVKLDASKQTFRRLWHMKSILHDFFMVRLFIKVVFKYILVRADICLKCLTYVPPTSHLLLPSPHLEKVSPSITPNFNFSCNRWSCIFFKFILFLHIGHADFTFNQCSISTGFCFKL